MRWRSVRGAVLLGVLGVVSIAHLSPAGMASATDADPADGTLRHFCVAVAYPAAAPASSPPVDPHCYGSLAAAVWSVTDGAVVLPRDAWTVTQAQLDEGRASRPATLTVIGIEYQNAEFGGADWVVTAPSGCADGGTEVWTVPDLSLGGWNNRVGSARTYASCKARHFEDEDFGGSSHLCGCASMGVLGNRTSAIRWSATGV